MLKSKMFKCRKDHDMAMQGVGVVVKFYGRQVFSVPPLHIPQDDFPLSCEHICVQSAKWLSEHSGKYFSKDSEKTIGPLLLPLFGLCTADHKLMQWIPDAHIFPTSTKQKEFYFRVKIRPVLLTKQEDGDDLVSDSSSMPEGIFTDYLFWQCVEDFLSGRVWTHYPMDIKINDVDSVNKVALWVIVAAANYKLQMTYAGIEASNTMAKVLSTPLGELAKLKDITKKVSFFNLPGHIPKPMPKDVQEIYDIGDHFMRWLAVRYLVKYIERFYEQWKQFPLSYIRQVFVINFMTKFVPYYLQEMFPASTTESSRTGEQLQTGNLDLIIKPHMDSCLPGIYRSRSKPIADLKSILLADINPFVDPQGNETTEYNVVLAVLYTPPKILKMKNRELALSFLSVVEQYCRLKFNYFLSLNQEHLTAPSLQVLIDFKSYGPWKEQDAVRFLIRKANDRSLHHHEALYIIYQDTDEFGLLHAVVWTKSASIKGVHNIHFNISNSIGRAVFDASFRVTVGTEEKTFHNPADVLSALDLSDGCYQLTPGDDDVCGAMQFLKDSSLAEDCYTFAYNHEERPYRKGTTTLEHLPFSFRSDQVTYSQDDLINPVGIFGNVYRLSEKVTGSKVVLKKVTDNCPIVQQMYRNGAEHLLKLNECCPLFVRLCGTVILSPFCMVLEEVGTHKNLHQRLQDKTAPSLNRMQIVSVWCQLAECLFYLKNKALVYGSFSCRKILIHRERDVALTIKLGDACQSQFFDQLSVEDFHNQQRLLLLAPERRQLQNGLLSKPTAQSDVFDFASVMFETLYRCWDPLQLLPQGMTSSQFLAEGKILQDLMLETLQVWEKVQVAQGDNSGAGSGDAASCPLQEDTSPDLGQASGTTESSVSGQHCYNKVKTFEQGSAVASGVTEKTNLSSAHDNEAEESYGDILQQFRTQVRSLMEKCWKRHPQERPGPKAVMNAMSLVEKRANTLRTASDSSNHLLFLQAAEETGMFNQDQLGACRLELQNHQERQDAGQVQESDMERKYEEDLFKKVRECADFLIDPSLLQFRKGDKKEEGISGEVRKATLRKPADSWYETANEGDVDTVAVKTIKDKDQRKEFLKEVLINSRLKHENIVKVIGVVLAGRNVQLVMEFADKDTLNHHINSSKCGKPTYKQKMLKYAIDVARGMKYLCEDNKMVHGDLATRNALLFSTGSSRPECFTAKVSDFGFSHKLVRGQREYYYYDLKKSKSKMPKRFPVSWMSREMVEDLMIGELMYLSFKSDVWSYGVMLWEMFTGLSPCGELNPNGLPLNELLRDLKRFYDNGERLSRGNCPGRMYDIMTQCWSYNHSERPDFSTLIRLLENLTDNDI